ncbi:TPA: barstar family protein [Salmonella enterica]|nr:barstar family protein [Salmonella enterica]
MSDLHEILDETGNFVLSCRELIECFDFSRVGDSYLFALIEPSIQEVDSLLINQIYTFKCHEFDGRLDFDFVVKKIIKSNGVLYLDLAVINGMYKVGVLSFLKTCKNNNGRIWLDMMQESKRIYISASYIIGGIRRSLEKDTIIIEGKYIHDYYSFYCEIGHAFFGSFGYMGNNLDAFDDCIVEVKRRDRQLNIIWRDSELSFKAINNTVPSEVYPLSSNDIINILKNHCNLTLE